MKIKIFLLNFILLILINLYFLQLGVFAAGESSDQLLDGNPSAKWRQTDFWFRDDNGTEITANGYGSSDINPNKNITEFVPESNFRLRFGIKAGTALGSISPQIEFKQGEGCNTGIWTKITSTSPDFIFQLSPNFDDGEATTQQISNGKFIAGEILESTNPALSLVVPKNNFTEYEWSLKASSDVLWGAEYVFRITDNGTELHTYSKCPSLAIWIPALPPLFQSPSPQPTILSLSGKAYPGAQIFLMEKKLWQEQLARQGAVLSDSGEFVIKNIYIPQGIYTYALLAQDKEGRQAQTKAYNINFLESSLFKKDIIISPTIDFVRSVVTRGDFIKVIGYASPKNKIKVELDYDIIYETVADEKGNYQILINTARLEFGRHSIRAKQKDLDMKQESDFSPTRLFSVSAVTVINADFNSDSKIDIKDWSIFLVRWNSDEKEGRKFIDLNRDENIDISDLSIFLRGFRA